MTHTIHKVQEFHEKFGHPVASGLTYGTDKLRELRMMLILEEACELAEALDLNIIVDNTGEEEDGPVIDIEQKRSHTPIDMVEVADALGDLDYVVQGANLVFGIPAEAVLDEIHRSNMSKLGADGKPVVREDGKILKGPNYFKPDIVGVLDLHRDLLPTERAWNACDSDGIEAGIVSFSVGEESISIHKFELGEHLHRNLPPIQWAAWQCGGCWRAQVGPFSLTCLDNQDGSIRWKISSAHEDEVAGGVAESELKGVAMVSDPEQSLAIAKRRCEAALRGLMLLDPAAEGWA